MPKLTWCDMHLNEIVVATYASSICIKFIITTVSLYPVYSRVMVTDKEVNNYTSWGSLYPHSRSNHGTETLWGNCKNYNLGHFFYLGRCGSLIVHACIYKESVQESMVVLNFETIGN